MTRTTILPVLPTCKYRRQQVVGTVRLHRPQGRLGGLRLWAQRALLCLARAAGAMPYIESVVHTVEARSAEILRDVFDEVHGQITRLERTGRGPAYIFVGYDRYREMIRGPLTHPIGFYVPDQVADGMRVFGVNVILVPMMTGVIVVPEFEIQPVAA